MRIESTSRDTIEISVLNYPEDGYWIAPAIELDYGTEGAPAVPVLRGCAPIFESVVSGRRPEDARSARSADQDP